MKKLLTHIILILGTLSILSCSDEKTEKQKTLKPLEVKTEKAKVTKTPITYSYPAEIQSDQQSNLSTRLIGQISIIKVKEGDHVKKGQLLAIIKSKDLASQKLRLKAQHSEAQVAYNNATKDLKRIKALFEQNSATQKELDDISTHSEIAKSKLEAIQHSLSEIGEHLSYANIVAPFSGIITKKILSEGDLASPGQPILSIQGTNIFKAKAKIPESEINLIKNGDEVKISINALNIRNLNGTVSSVNPSGNFSGPQYEINVVFNADKNIKNKFKSGLYATISFTKGYNKRVLLPKSALIIKGQLKGLYAVDNQKKALLRWIRTGREHKDAIEVLAGLNEGEDYIISYDGKIYNGTPVLIQN